MSKHSVIRGCVNQQITGPKTGSKAKYMTSNISYLMLA